MTGRARRLRFARRALRRLLTVRQRLGRGAGLLLVVDQAALVVVAAGRCHRRVHALGCDPAVDATWRRTVAALRARGRGVIAVDHGRLARALASVSCPAVVQLAVVDGRLVPRRTR